MTGDGVCRFPAAISALCSSPSAIAFVDRSGLSISQDVEFDKLRVRAKGECEGISYPDSTLVDQNRSADYK